MKTLSLVLLIPFLALTAYAIMDVGYVHIFTYQFGSSGGWQVLVDLVIALILLWSLILIDARKSGRNPWPFMLATLFVGSIAPLLYFVLGKKD